MSRVSPATAARLVVAALSLAVATACASARSDVPTGVAEPDRYLLEKGTASLADKKWYAAREYFRRLLDAYPQSQHRPDAKLGLADSYLGENSTESLILAQSEYREFLTFFPTHARADYAQYKLGMAHFAQMRHPQRDQTETRDAVRELQAFVDRFPESPLMPEARGKLREARDRLSTSEYQVGVFYYRQRWYPGAIDRLKGVLKDDPEFTKRDAAYYYLGDALVKVNRPAEALPYFDRLLAEFDSSEFLELTKQRVAELKSAPPAPAPNTGTAPPPPASTPPPG